MIMNVFVYKKVVSLYRNLKRKDNGRKSYIFLNKF